MKIPERNPTQIDSESTRWKRRGLGLTSMTKPDPRGGGPVRGGTWFRWWLRPRSHERQADENGPPLARGSQNRLSVPPPRGSRTRLASRNHEGMCREAAAFAKQGRHKLARPRPDRPLCSTLALSNTSQINANKVSDRKPNNQFSEDHPFSTLNVRAETAHQRKSQRRKPRKT